MNASFVDQSSSIEAPPYVNAPLDLRRSAQRLKTGETISVKLQPARSSGWVWELRAYLQRHQVRPGLLAKYRCRRAVAGLRPEHPLRAVLERYLLLTSRKRLEYDLLLPRGVPIDFKNFYKLTSSLGLSLVAHSAHSKMDNFGIALKNAGAPASVCTRYQRLSAWEKFCLLDDLCELDFEPNLSFKKVTEKPQLALHCVPALSEANLFSRGSQTQRMSDGLDSALIQLDPDREMPLSVLAAVLEPRVNLSGQVIPGLSSGDLLRTWQALGLSDDQIRETISQKSLLR